MRRFGLILFCAALLCGCMQSKNIDEYAYVLNIGVERGTTMPYLVTFLVSLPGGTEETKVENTVISAEARSLSEATEILNTAYPSRLSLSRASLLAIGEDLAAEGAQTAFLDFSFGKADLWQNLRVVVAKPPIRKVFEGWISDADPSLRKIKTSVGDLMKESGITADTGYSTYLEAVFDDRFDALLAYTGENTYELQPDPVGDEAYPERGGSLPVSGLLKTTTAGSAFFSGDRMVGVLDARHTMEVLMVLGTFRRGELQFTLPDGRPIRVTLYRLRAPKIRLSEGDASVSVFLEADPSDPERLPINRAELKAFLEDRLETELCEVFSVLQRAGSDAMGFGRYAAKRFRSVGEWKAYDWKTAYRSLSVSFSVTVMLSPQAHGAETG